VVWWLFILPVAFVMDYLGPVSQYWAFALGLGYLVLLPLLLGRLQERLLRRYIAELEVVVPGVMTAFSCLRTTAVRVRLETLHTFIGAQRPRERDPKDVFVKLLDTIEEHIDDAAKLAERDGDTIFTSCK